MFPSLTEGRGLPILESAAAGIPIVCSRYEPGAVFAALVGEGRAREEQILYEPFPEGTFDAHLLDAVADMVFHPWRFGDRIKHNRSAVRSRFSMASLQGSLRRCLSGWQDVATG